MPATVGSKPPEPARKKPSEETKKVESAKSLVKESEPKCDDTVAATIQSLPAEGETVVKKSTPRKRVAEERKSGSSVTDRVPKTKAQRAKGSIALNKAIDKADSESTGKKQAPSRSIDRLSRPSTREGVALTENRRAPVTVRSKAKVKAEGMEPKKVQKRKPWVAVMEKASNETINEKPVGVVEQESKEVKNEEIRPMNTASNSCSFFEKLQQGVRAYFGSRNSFNPSSMDDKNKKKVTEGGIRTRARVAKGVKEDRKKTKPRKILKNKKCNSESDLWYDQFRLNSSLGGQSSNSLDAKPKIFRHFRKLKRKKLYCPIKHCVRIQIPRKGYFYRSTVRFKAPGSSPSMQRVESNVVPKSKSKVQIPRLASTSSESPNLLKKRLKKKRKDAKLVAQSAAPRIPCSPVRVEHLSSAPSKEVLMCGLDEKAVGRTASNRSQLTRLPASKSKPSREASPERTGGRKISAALENPMSCNDHPPKNQTKRKCKSKSGKKLSSSRGTEDASPVLETFNEQVISVGKNDIRTPPPSQSSLDTLLSCISRILGKDEGIYDLQITPVRIGGGEFSLDSDFPTLADSPVPQNLQITEVVTTFENCYDVNSPEPDTIYLSPKASLTLQESIDGGDYGFASEDAIAKMLIGEIDLHLELENYLREIECFSGARNRTKNTLQCNLCDEHYPLNGSGLDLEDYTKEFFEVTEIKSNSTFASATSICTQQDGDTNKLRVFLDHKHDMASMSEDYFDSRNSKVFMSQTQFTSKSGVMRKIKSENNPTKKIQQEGKLKSSIRRTFGKTSFQSPRAEMEEKTWALSPLRSDVSTDSSIDSYEKILPLGWQSNKSSDEMKKRSSLLYTNSVYSLSAESFPATVRKSASESDRCQERTEPSENAESDEPLELQLQEEVSSSSLISEATPQLQPKRRLWSPSLQELIEIYNNVLKHNKKIRSNSRTSVSRCISSHLFSFLNEELKEKECKANLLMLSRKLNRRLKAPEVWKPGRQKNDNTLEEYVTMFQEILKSSLSISQIARLNNIISGLQEYSEKNYDFVKNIKAKRKEDKMMKAEGLAREVTAPEPQSEEEEERAPMLPPPKKSRKKFPNESAIRTARPLPKRCPVRRKKVQNPEPKVEEPVPIEEITKIELTSPTELESILQSCFAAEDAGGLNPRDPNNKIMVTVKLRGNQVLVSRLLYFKNEKALMPGKTKENGTSELIIESVPKDQVKDVYRKKTKNGKPKEVNKSGDPEKPESETRINVESKKVTTPKKVHSKATTATPTGKRGRQNKGDDNSVPLREFAQPKTLLPFEYDQMQLRAQHPIEAIIESSESRISEHVESSDDDQSYAQLKPPPEKKILLTDIRNKTTLKEALMEALADNLYSKDLNCDFGWDEEKILDKSLSRTKSYVISREMLKKQTFAQKPLKHAETARSLSDLMNKPKSRRKGRRKVSSFMCYPSILNLQRKPVTVKKKCKRQCRQKNQTSNFRIPSNSALYPQQPGVAKRSSKMSNSKIVTSDAEGPQLSAPNALQETTDGVAKSPTDVAMCDSDEALLDCSSMELLYYDNENPSTSVTPKVSASMVKATSKTASSEHLPLPSEGKGTNCIPPTAMAVDGIKGSPIVIHPPRNDSDDTIFHSVMIHSDSFLKKCYSSLPLTKTNLYSLLKSSSEMKFYPGRVSSSDKQQNPFVKFVLTPSQNANAGLPPNQVHVVDKKHATEDAVVESVVKEKPKSATEEIDEKIPFSSIEKFIRKLSRGKKKERAKSKDPGKAEPSDNKETPPTASKSGQRKKCPVPGKQSSPKATERKPYHECQKRRLIDKAKTTEKKPKAADSKTKLNKDKEKSPPEPQQENSEINLLSLKKFMLILSQVMESYENFSKETVKNQTEGKREADRAGGAAVAEPDLRIEEMSTEGHLEKSTNTIPENKCSLMRVLDFSPDVPAKRVQPVKSVVTQTDDVRYVMGRAEGELEREAEGLEVCDNADCRPRSSKETPPPRKPKTLKIKIHCDERSPCKDGSKAGKAGQNEVKSPVLGRGRGNLQQQLSERVGVLESLVKGEPEGGALERRNSVYFDALEGYSDEEAEGGKAEGKISNSRQEFMAYWATVDPINMSEGLLIKEESDGRPNSAVPEVSAERVFDEILNSLQNDKICHSLRLLDDFLRKVEFSGSWGGNPDRLRNVLLLVSSKSKSLMIGMEKNAWLKVLSLLEDISQMFANEQVDSQGSQNTFVEKIRGLNDSRLVDLQNFCSLSQTAIRSKNRSKNVLSKIKDSINYLRNKISVRRSHSANSIQSTVHLPETPAALEGSIDQPQKNPLQHLRKHIQQQKTYIEFLLSADCGDLPQQIQDVKGKVIEKMRTFEKMFSVLSEGCSIRESPLGQCPLPVEAH